MPDQDLTQDLAQTADPKQQDIATNRALVTVSTAAPSRSLIDRFLDIFRGKPADIREELSDALSEQIGRAHV